MLLTFSSETFKDKIIEGIKIQSCRVDQYNRWKEDMNIEFWMHSPRNVKKNPYQFGRGKVHEIHGVQLFEDRYILTTDWDVTFDTKEALNFFARCDGFETWEQLSKWFKLGKKPWTGRIIYWDQFEQI